MLQVRQGEIDMSIADLSLPPSERQPFAFTAFVERQHIGLTTGGNKTVTRRGNQASCLVQPSCDISTMSVVDGALSPQARFGPPGAGGKPFVASEWRTAGADDSDCGDVTCVCKDVTVGGFVVKSANCEDEPAVRFAPYTPDKGSLSAAVSGGAAVPYGMQLLSGADQYKGAWLRRRLVVLESWEALFTLNIRKANI